MARPCSASHRTLLASITSCALLTISLPAFAQTTLFSEDFDGAWTTPTTLQSDTCASPPCFWNGEGTGDNEWHRNNYFVGWTGSGGGYAPGGASSTTNSARFNSSDAVAGTSGALLTPWISIYGTRGPLAVSFWYINPSGTDSVFVSYSHDGVNFTRVLRLGTAAAWTQVYANVGPAGFYSSLQVKIEAVSDDGATDLGIDQFGVYEALAGTTYVGAGERLTNFTEAVAEYDSAVIVMANAAYKATANYQGIDTEMLPLTLISVPRVPSNPTVSFGPDSGVATTTAGSSPSAVFIFDGADYCILDGEGAWNVTNTNVAGATASVWLRQGATNNVVRDLYIMCGVNPPTSNLETFGIISSGALISNSSDGTNNDNNIIEGNTVLNAQWGIYCRGAIANPNDNNIIRRNVIGPASFGPLRLRRGGIIAQHQNALTITENEVRSIGMLSSDTATATDAIAIGVGSNVYPPAATVMTGATVTRNQIYSIVNGKANTAAGIVVASSVTHSTNTVANNIIRDITANGGLSDQAVGIAIGAGSGDRVVFNTLRLYGDLDGAISATQSAVGIRVQSASAANLTVKNNVVAVGWTSNTGSLRHYCEVVPSAGFSWGTGGNDRNDYWADPNSAQATLGGLGTTVPYTPVSTLPAWRTQFTPNQDSGSIDTQPPFMTSTDLHIQTGQPTGIESGAVPIAGVTHDYDVELRHVSAPDMGMDEGDFTPLIGNFAPDFREHFSVVPRWGETMTMSPRAYDRTCLPVTYSAPGLPAGASINPTNGRITWNVPDCPGTAHGTITVLAVDSCGLSDTLRYEYDALPRLVTSCYIREAYVPKCVTYPADGNGDFAEDALMVGPPADSVVVWLIFNRCHALAGESRDSVEVYSRIVWEPEIVPAALIKTRRSHIPHLTGMFFVSMVTANHTFGGSLTLSGQVLGVRPSATYSPATVEDSLLTIDGTGATVAILDSGVDGNHESLTGKYLSGLSFVSGDGDSTSGDPPGDDHGTGMAGAAVGRGSPTFQNIGMGKGASYVDVRVLLPDGMGGHVGTEADVIAGLQYVLANYPGTIVYLGIEGDALSYGADPSVLWNGTDLLSTVITAVTQLGLIVVVPVGNTDVNNTPLLPPSVAEDAIVVGASAHMNTVPWSDDEIASFSKFGPREPDLDGDTVDEEIPHIVAPGTDLNTGGSGIIVPRANAVNQYVGVQGTSVAAAQVAGIVAMMQQVTGGGMSTTSVRQFLMDTADEVVPPAARAPDARTNAVAWGPAWGHGLVNGFRVIDLLVPMANVGFDSWCFGPGEWYYSTDIEVLDPILLDDSVRVRVHIHNKSLIRSLAGLTIELGAYSFGNGPFQGTFHTFVDSTTLPPNGHRWYETKWYVNPGLEKPHGCLKAFLSSPRDGASFDNCAQRNVDIIGYGSSNLVAGSLPGRVWPARTQSPAPSSRMFVANVLPSNIQVSLVPTIVSGSGWTLACSETSLAFPMLKNEPPREVIWHGVPGGAATDSAVWTVEVHEAGECAEWNSGGGRIVARKSELTGTEEVIVQVPTLVMSPRPFRKNLDISFGMPKAGPVKLQVYDVLGREVWRIDLGFQRAGMVRAHWDGRMHGGVDASPGVYFVRAHLGDAELGGRVVRLK